MVEVMPDWLPWVLWPAQCEAAIGAAVSAEGVVSPSELSSDLLISGPPPGN